MKYKYKIAQIIIIVFVVIIACVMFFACGSKLTNAEPSHAETYELYTLNESCGESRLILYDTYKVKSENINSTESYGNVITIYNAIDGTQIIFADNGVTVISPQSHKESFTQGYMRRE